MNKSFFTFILHINTYIRDNSIFEIFYIFTDIFSKNVGIYINYLDKFIWVSDIFIYHNCLDKLPLFF